MCNDCAIIASLFEAASKSEAHKNYFPTLSFLIALEKQVRIKLYAGDCQLSEAIAVLESDLHYTVLHYFQCIQCAQNFLLGACIRGTPIYKFIEDISKENLVNKIWGRVGVYYCNHDSIQERL